MITIRQAEEHDAPAIREIFLESYGEGYIYPDYYDERYLKKLIFADDTLMLVAEESPEAEILGTATVVLESGAYTDLVGEFGRLAVRPEARHRGVGGMLLAERIRRVEDRLHVGFMEARVTLPFSVQNALAHGFVPVGFMPMRLQYGQGRESTALLVRYFGQALQLRRNHPRIVPEAYRLAALAMEQLGLELDAIVDETAAPYPCDDRFKVERLTTEGYSSLLRIERGRLRDREIFGPLRLHYGFHCLESHHSTYLIAHRDDTIAGAVGFTLDEFEGNVRVFELISVEEHAIRFLLAELERRVLEMGQFVSIEIDVNADAPSMQRTLLELGYLPVAYVPALAFHQVERLDVLKMFRLLRRFEPGQIAIVEAAEAIARHVLALFERREALPRLGKLVGRIELFDGLTEEQMLRLAGVSSQRTYEEGDLVFGAGEESRELLFVMEGRVRIELGDAERVVGRVGAGDSLGEVALLTDTAHSASATAITPVKVGVLPRRRLLELMRQRPDIAVVLYRNLARGLGEKLRRADRVESRDPARAGR